MKWKEKKRNLKENSNNPESKKCFRLSLINLKDKRSKALLS